MNELATEGLATSRRTRLPELERVWWTPTEEHETQLRRLEESFEEFNSGQQVDPLAIVGAYRSGKTQLMYHMFRESWDMGIPAIYIGNPKSMLNRFQESGEASIVSWLEEEMEAQLEALVNRDFEAIEWFPNAPSEQKEQWIEDHIPSDFDLEGTQRRALFVDELEQSYEQFLSTLDTDDENPLRIISDDLTDVIKVWGFGMLSAYEFIGEADIGRMKEIKVPPLDVQSVREILQEENESLGDLANIVWWLARGRTGWVLKIVEEIDESVLDDLEGWLEDLTEHHFQEVELIEPIWTEDVPADQYGSAIRAIAFQSDGYEEWMVDDQTALTKDQLRDIAFGSIRDSYDFPTGDTGSRARQMLRRNLERVAASLSVTEQEYFPQRSFSNPEEAEAFLELAKDLTISFEPNDDARSAVLDSLDSVDDSFHSDAFSDMMRREGQEVGVTTTKPSKINAAFPPVAVNPKILSSRGVDELEEEMVRGLEIGIDSDVNVYFCPTEEILVNQADRIADQYDIGSPSVLIIPEDLNIELPDRAEILERHELLTVEKRGSSRLWDFVPKIYAYLDEQNIEKPYYIDSRSIAELTTNAEQRELRNTIDTLFEQVERIATDSGNELENRYFNRFSRPNVSQVLWAEPDLDNGSPWWHNAPLADERVALSYMLVFGKEPDWTLEYKNLHNYLEEGFDESLVSGSGFKYTEFLDTLYRRGGYTQTLKNRRGRYQTPASNQYFDCVHHLQNLLRELVEEWGVERAVESLKESDLSETDSDIPILNNPANKVNYTTAFLRANLLVALTKDRDNLPNVIDDLEEVKEQLQAHKQTISEEYLEQVNEINEQLTPPGDTNVGEWIDLVPEKLQDYHDHVEDLETSLQALIDHCERDPDMKTVGYAYWVLLTRYERNLEDAIQDLDSELGTLAEINNITDLRSTFKELYEHAEDFEPAVEYFGSQQNLLAEIEAIGNDIFDLRQQTGGAGQIAVPTDVERVQELNDYAEDHISELEQLRTDLVEIESKHEELQSDFENAKSDLDEFFETVLDGGDNE